MDQFGYRDESELSLAEKNAEMNARVLPGIIPAPGTPWQQEVKQRQERLNRKIALQSRHDAIIAEVRKATGPDPGPEAHQCGHDFVDKIASAIEPTFNENGLNGLEKLLAEAEAELPGLLAKIAEMRVAYGRARAMEAQQARLAKWRSEAAALEPAQALAELETHGRRLRWHQGKIQYAGDRLDKRQDIILQLHHKSIVEALKKRQEYHDVDVQPAS